MIIIAADEQGELEQPEGQPAVQAPPAPTEPTPEPPTAPQPQVVPPIRTVPGKNLPGLIGEYLASQDPERSRLRQEIYTFGTDDERLKAIQNAYNSSNDDNVRNDLIELVFACPVEFKSKKGATRRAIGSQLADSYKGEDAQVMAYTAIWNALNPKIGNPYHYITYIWGHNKRHRPRTEKDVFNERDTNAMVAYRAFKPYILFMENPDSPPGGSKPVDKDLVAKVDNWEIDEDAAIWMQYRRDVLRDRDGRVDKAIRWTMDTLKKINEQAVKDKPGQRPPAVESMLASKIDEKTLELAISLGIGEGPDIPQGDFEKRLIQREKEIFQKKYIQKAAAKAPQTGEITKFQKPLSNPLWVKLAKAWLNDPAGAPLTFDDWLTKKLHDKEAEGATLPEGTFRPAEWHPSGWLKMAKEILKQYGPSVGVNPEQWEDENSPYFLNVAMLSIGFEGAMGPKYIDTARWKMQDEQELGYMPSTMDPKAYGQQKPEGGQEVPMADLPKAPREQTVDYRNLQEPEPEGELPGQGFQIVSPADAKTTDKKTKERKKLVSPENPKFRETIKGIIRELYSPFAMTGKSEDQQATDSVLSDIGNMMSKRFVPQDAEDVPAAERRNAALAEETFMRIKSLLTEPLLLKHFPDSPGNTPLQRFQLAQMEVAKDINLFLADDAKMTTLDRTLALPKVAMLRDEIRRAMFLCAPRLQRTASVKPRIIEYLIDNLFGETPKGTIAKFICMNDGPISPASVAEIRAILSKEHKREAKVLDSFLFDLMDSARETMSKFLKDDSKVEKMAEDLKTTAAEIRAALKALNR